MTKGEENKGIETFLIYEEKMEEHLRRELDSGRCSFFFPFFSQSLFPYFFFFLFFFFFSLSFSPLLFTTAIKSVSGLYIWNEGQFKAVSS